MAYCHWCQMDSESEDTCVWCRRPLTRTYSAFGNVALLRDDQDSSSDRTAGVIGGLVLAVFLGVVVYASVNHRGGRAESAMNAQAKAADVGALWQGERAQASQPEAPLTLPPIPSVRNVPIASSGPVAATPRSMSTASAGALAATPSSVAMTSDGGAVANGIFIETATFTAYVQKNGKYTVEGTVYLVNVSGETAENLLFRLMVADKEFDVTSSVKEIPHGMTATIAVRVVDLPREVATSAGASLHVSAKTSTGLARDRISLRE